MFLLVFPGLTVRVILGFGGYDSAIRQLIVKLCPILTLICVALVF